MELGRSTQVCILECSRHPDINIYIFVRVTLLVRETNYCFRESLESPICIVNKNNLVRSLKAITGILPVFFSSLF